MGKLINNVLPLIIFGRTTGKFSIPSGDNTESISSLFTSKLLFCVSLVRGLLTSIASGIQNYYNLTYLNDR